MKKDAPKMGKLLAEYGFIPDMMISSPANRALKTAEIIAEQLEFTRNIRQERRFYEEGHGAMFSALQNLPEEVENVMLFGHNPTMENLSAFLMQMQAGIVMPTCAMLCLEAQTSTWS
ncbi:MAG: histidine phosphatase family protein, partial [Methylococcaceae bacterium]|nr:histidine phosphatase family protein [Methylococcaceae bacterium]